MAIDDWSEMFSRKKAKNQEKQVSETIAKRKAERDAEVEKRRSLFHDVLGDTEKQLNNLDNLEFVLIELRKKKGNKNGP